MKRKFKPIRAKGKTGPKPPINEAMLKQTELLGKMGATNDQLAQFFEKSVKTIDYWLKNYKEFYDARKKGQMEADAKVAESLFKRATGYDFVEEELKFINRRLKRVKVRKHVVPDVKAIMFWLSNRQREQWTVYSQVKHSGNVYHKHTDADEIPIDQLSVDAQKYLFEIGMNQLTDGSRQN